MGRLTYFCFYILLLHNAIALSRIDPLVDTNVGLIRGLRADDGDYSKFLGIPYATVNAENPFGDATPYPPFEEPFEAYDDTPLCPQIADDEALGDINCLHLNVNVPTTATSKNPLPVMLYIHGGHFTRKTYAKSHYSMKYLVQNDVIVVSFNYRLGVYGFMCLDSPDASGNQGLKDQLIALKWVKENIRAFGGDPNKITLIGNSAGAHSIDFHLLSSKEKLFNQIILISGTSLATTVFYEPDKTADLKITHHLGFEANTTEEALSFLAELDPPVVVAAATELGIVFKPCVETQFDGVEPFITNHWVNVKVPKVKNMPVLLGFNQDELAMSHFFEDAEYYQNLDLVSEYLERTFEFDEDTFEEMKQLVSDFYFGDEKMSEDLKWEIIRFDSDYTYIHPIQRTIKRYLENGAGKIYQYMFSYVGERSSINTDDHEPNRGACCTSHADELQYLFEIGQKPELTAEDKLIMQIITKMWTNFAKFGDPTPETSEMLPVKWLPVTSEKNYYLNINSELTLESSPVHERMAFWNLFYKYNEKLQKGYVEI